MKKLLRRIFSRFPFVALTIIALFAVFFAVILVGIITVDRLVLHYYPSAEPYVRTTLIVLAYFIVIITVLHAANRDMVPETKIPWILCIVVLNVLGVAIYATFSSHKPSRKSRKLYKSLQEQMVGYEKRIIPKETLHVDMGHWADISEALFVSNPSAVVHSGTRTEYFSSGQAFLARLLGDLERAEKYIFLEYFIIERGKMWNSILAILERKVKEGVEIRMMYDDIGCMGKIHLNYHNTLKKKGIDCVKFNPFVPVVTNVHNNRDHRKILVIDGKIGYTGGLNLADEYINETHPFGDWKDTAVRLEGAGVSNLVMMFLRLYCMQKRRVEDVSKYLPDSYEKFGDEGYVQPYGDGPVPLYERHLSENVYIDIINGARSYVWITTPYLIIDYSLRQALILAARRGVDVRILTPHIPDKKIPFALTRSNYMALMRGGVKVYEYTPGFVHAKNFLADDEIGVVGTVNLDYRSFLYHFEDAVLMYRTSALKDMKADMVRTFSVSALQTEEDAKRSVVWRWICEIAKLFAPLF